MPGDHSFLPGWNPQKRRVLCYVPGKVKTKKNQDLTWCSLWQVALQWWSSIAAFSCNYKGVHSHGPLWNVSQGLPFQLVNVSSGIPQTIEIQRRNAPYVYLNGFFAQHVCCLKPWSSWTATLVLVTSRNCNHQSLQNEESPESSKLIQSPVTWERKKTCFVVSSPLNKMLVTGIINTFLWPRTENENIRKCRVPKMNGSYRMGPPR